MLFRSTMVEPDTRQTFAYFDEIEMVTFAPVGTGTPARDATEPELNRAADDSTVRE